MSKQWKPNPFRHLEKHWLRDFRKQQEEKLDADHNWSPKTNLPPIGNEYAIPLDPKEGHTN